MMHYTYFISQLVGPTGFMFCDLALKDSDMCLQYSKGWDRKDTCANSKPKCDKAAKDMKRCCPETCNSKNFTKEVCEKSGGTGECKYPFHARSEECLEVEKGKAKLQTH